MIEAKMKRQRMLRPGSGRDHNRGILLFSDQACRTIAGQHQIEVHGVLWVIDQLRRHGSIDSPKPHAALVTLDEDPPVWLPQKELHRRIELLLSSSREDDGGSSGALFHHPGSSWSKAASLARTSARTESGASPATLRRRALRPIDFTWSASTAPPTGLPAAAP